MLDLIAIEGLAHVTKWSGKKFFEVRILFLSLRKSGILRKRHGKLNTADLIPVNAGKKYFGALISTLLMKPKV